MAGHAATPAASDSTGDQVDLHQASAREVALAQGQETLLALLQGLLEVMAAQPLRIEDPHPLPSAPYDQTTAPAWLLAARHGLAQHPAEMVRLSATGQLTLADARPQPFVLDIQLLHPWPGLTTRALSGCMQLEPHASADHRTRVDFCLSLITDFPAASRCKPQPAVLHPPLAATPSGTPLFVQFSVDGEPEILSMAARLLPAAREHAVPMRASSWRDGGYVDKEARRGSDHQVDISA